VKSNDGGSIETYNKAALSELISILDESNVGFVDTHVHFEYLLQRIPMKGSMQLADMSTSEKEQKLIEYLCFNTSSKDQMDKIINRMNAFVCVFCDPTSFSSLGIWRDVISMDKLNVNVTFGLHPHNAKYYDEKMQERINQCIVEAGPKCVAYGECGLDYHYNNSTREEQVNCFTKQLQNAVFLGLPVVVHAREAEEDAFNILTENLPKDWKIHVHCFTDSLKFAQKLMDHFPNLFIGFTGVISYDPRKKGDDTEDEMVKVLKNVSLDRMLLETDGPYMPVKLNVKSGKARPLAHSGHIPLIANRIAQAKSIPVSDVLEQARINTMKMYGI